MPDRRFTVVVGLRALLLACVASDTAPRKMLREIPGEESDMTYNTLPINHKLDVRLMDHG